MNAPQPSLDAVFDLLVNPHRRYVLYSLAEADDELVLKLENIADQAVAWEREWDTSESSETTDRQKQIHIDLHHNHLSRLADTGVIDYDGYIETIRNSDTPSLEVWAEKEGHELSRFRALFGLEDTDGRDPSLTVEM